MIGTKVEVTSRGVPVEAMTSSKRRHQGPKRRTRMTRVICDLRDLAQFFSLLFSVLGSGPDV